MATNYTLPSNGKPFLALLAACALLFSRGRSFKKGMQYYQEGKYTKADKVFIQKMNRRTWDLAATYHHERIRLTKARTLSEWPQSDALLCGILEMWMMPAAPLENRRLHWCKRPGVFPDWAPCWL